MRIHGLSDFYGNIAVPSRTPESRTLASLFSYRALSRQTFPNRTRSSACFSPYYAAKCAYAARGKTVTSESAGAGTLHHWLRSGDTLCSWHRTASHQRHAAGRARQGGRMPVWQMPRRSEV